jgi:hypothetical protein
VANKSICSIPSDWTLEEYSRHSCGDGSHHHLSHSQIHELEISDVVVWLRKSANRREKGVVQILAVPAGHAAPLTRSPASPDLAKGLSLRVGEQLAKSIRQRRLWAQVMFSEITMRPLESNT